MRGRPRMPDEERRKCRRCGGPRSERLKDRICEPCNKLRYLEKRDTYIQMASDRYYEIAADPIKMDELRTRKRLYARKWRAMNPEAESTNKRRWLSADPERRRAYIRRQNLKKYDLTPESYAELLRAQEGKCSICKMLPDGTSKATAVLYVDHDHTTGKVRSLLCHYCNAGLGSLKDSPTLLRAAADYLERHAYDGLVKDNDTPESAR